MERYEGATMIKSYRGHLEDDGQDHIRIKTNEGNIGYRIVKFEAVPRDPMTQDQENVLKIYKLKQSSVDGRVEFTDGDLLGVSLVKYTSDAALPAIGNSVIFDNEIINQDIFVTNEDVGAGGRSCNYYIELEQVKLNENESTMATLQSLRRLALPRN